MRLPKSKAGLTLSFLYLIVSIFLILSQGLFGEQSVVLFRGVFENEEYEEYIIHNLEMLASSPTLFLIWEEKLTKKKIDTIKKYAEEVVVFEKRAVLAKEEFSIFTIADALGRRDKKRAWMLLQRAYSESVASEHIYGILFWQVKVIALVQSREKEKATFSSLNLKPFVLGKAEQYSKNYTEEETKCLLGSLIDVYHRARGGREEFSIGLERLILSL